MSYLNELADLIQLALVLVAFFIVLAFAARAGWNRP